ncbi:MAG: carboxypeptidase regulatory-like domain-containing protein [bacterium]|nr:carboxypeptidase regulatory-like domain-containing protein [bacterium]
MRSAFLSYTRPVLLALAAVLTVLIVTTAPHSAKAATTTTSIRIRVIDASDAQPISLARVFLVGKHSEQGYTDASGVVEFDGVAAGTYRISVYEPEYSRAVERFAVQPGAHLELTATLARRGGLSTIATIVVHTVRAGGSNHAVASSPQALARGGLSGLLADMPSVSATKAGVALDGLGTNGTPVTIDGSPIAGNGGSVALSPIGMDLFSSVTADPLGGLQAPNIGLTTDDPTIAFSENGILKTDDRGAAGGIFGATGTFGSTGFTLRGVDESSVGPLEGRVFSDTSGLRYGHVDEAYGRGIQAKVRAPVSASQSLLFEIGGLGARSEPACNVASGGTPCGYGPQGRIERRSLSNASLRDAFAFPNADLTLSASRSTERLDDDGSNRIVGGASSPTTSSLLTSLAAFSARFEQSLGTRATMRADASIQDQTTSGSASGVAFPASRQRFEALTLSYEFNPTVARAIDVRAYAPLDGASAGASASYQVENARGSQGAVLLRLGQPRQPFIPQLPVSGSLYDPVDAEYDCLHQRVFVNGLGALTGVPADTGATLAYRRDGARMAIDARASYDVISGGDVATLLPGSPSGPNAISPSVLATIQQIYASPSVCGAPVALAPSAVAVLAQQQATMRYGNVVVSAAFRVGSLALAPFVQYTSARSRIAGSDGAVPFVPQYRAGAILDAPLFRGRTDALAYANYVGPNNAQSLPPHLEASIGVSEALPIGTLSFGIENLFGTWSPRFASSAFALPLQNGITPIAQPLAPRTWHLSLRAAIGKTAPAPHVDSLAALAAAAQPAGDVFTLKFHVLDDRTPAFAFEPDTSEPACTPEALALAQPILRAMKRDVDRYGAGADDERIALALGRGDGLAITEIRGDHHVAFEITSTSSRSEARFIACTTLRVATPEQLIQRHAYIPTQQESDAGYVFVDPNVGVYRVIGALPTPPPVGSDNSAIVLDPAPPAPPERPFAIRRSCPKRLQPFARNVLTELSAIARPLLDGRSVTPSKFFHASRIVRGSRVWLRIDFLDPLSVDTLERCAHVAGLSAYESARRGFAGIGDGIQYASELGLFTRI